MDTKNLLALRASLNASFPERSNVVDGILSALLLGEHVFVLGPPGTAKSAMVRAVSGAVKATYFERLLTKFSAPEELFGPVSLKGLEQDIFRRNVAGQLPEAEVAFLDECFKANSAILNSLLTMMNERLYSNGGQPQKCPLVTLVGASNELPQGAELEALFDRFLFRYDVAYLLRPANFKGMILAAEPQANGVTLTLAELAEHRKAIARVVVTDATVDALIEVRELFKSEGIQVSDRRWKKAVSVLRCQAYLDGRADTDPTDLSELTDCLWREPKERRKIAKLIGGVADPIGVKVNEILDAARETGESLILSLKSMTDRKEILKANSVALEAFDAQRLKLSALTVLGPSKKNTAAITAASAEIATMRAGLARQMARSLSIG